MEKILAVLRKGLALADTATEADISAALCRQGATDGWDLDKAACFSVTVQDNSAMDMGSMDTEDALMEKILAVLRKGLGLADTATEEDISKALTSLSAAFASLRDNPPSDLLSKLTTLTARLDAADTKIAGYQAEIDKRDRAEICLLAVREGKVLPLSVEQVNATPIATLRDMVKNLAVTVPLSQRTPEHVVEFSVTGAGVVTDMDKEVARKCGIDPEKLQKK